MIQTFPFVPVYTHICKELTNRKAALTYLLAGDNHIPPTPFKCHASNMTGHGGTTFGILVQCFAKVDSSMEYFASNSFEINV